MLNFVRSALLGLLLFATPRASFASPVVVFAAASLADAFQDVATAWKEAGHDEVVLNFASSGALARQLDQGAPAGIFVSADLQWMDWASARSLIAVDTRRDLLGNELVLVTGINAKHMANINPSLDLLGLLGPEGRLAIGDPDSVPAGQYARQALTKSGLWSRVEQRLARAENVRAALLLVQRGEAAAAIVYATDARASAKDVAVVATFPAASHDPIVYPAAVVRYGDTADARALLAFLGTPVAEAIFKRYGFSTLRSE